MTREDAYEFIRLYRKFVAANTGLTIRDLVSDDEIELQTAGGNVLRKTDWYAAKTIEACSIETD